MSHDQLRVSPAVSAPSGDGPGKVPSPETGSHDDSPSRTATGRTLRSWPLLLLALPAAVAVWSGWVGSGQMTGFGQVHPLPGIWNSLHLDTAITLPIGVEAYAAYALRAWLARDLAISARTRRFAKWSAICSFALGMAGQGAYHLMAQAGMTRAPWASPPSCPACRSWSWAWGPRWRICSGPTPRPPMRRTAGPDHQRPCGPCPRLPRTEADQAAGNRRRTGAGSRSGTRTARQRTGSAAVESRDLISRPPGHRWIRPSWSPAGSPRPGSPCHGERCAAAESGVPTRR